MIVVVENEGIVDEILGIKDTPKAYPVPVQPIWQQSFRGQGRLQAGFQVAKITGKYIWKYHKKQLLSWIGVGGGVIALSQGNPSLRSLTVGQARSNMVKSGTRRIRRSVRPTHHCCPTKC